MKLFCDLLARRRSNKKKITTIKLSSSPIQSTNQSLSPFYDQTSSLFNKQSRCTCHYFNLNGNYLTENITTKSFSNNHEYLFDTKYILSVADFCLWYDVRSTLLDMIDQVVTMNEVCHLNTQSNTIQRKVRRPKTSIAIQTLSNNCEQRRNAKVQTNTLTLFH